MAKIPALCPCGSTLAYKVCCGKYHKGKLQAPTAEALMRSRFSAYVIGNPQYIFRTWDVETRPTLQSLRESQTDQFTSLEVLSTTDGSDKDQYGTVEFVAKFKVGDDSFEHHENSQFRRHKDRWVYVEAI